MAKPDHNPKKMRTAAMAFFEDKDNGGVKIITVSKLKALISAMGLRMDGELPAELAKKLVQDLYKSALRAVDNKRSTIRPSDL